MDEEDGCCQQVAQTSLPPCEAVAALAVMPSPAHRCESAPQQQQPMCYWLERRQGASQTRMAQPQQLSSRKQHLPSDLACHRRQPHQQQAWPFGHRFAETVLLKKTHLNPIFEKLQQKWNGLNHLLRMQEQRR